jgi:hypothetical protein
MIRHPTEQGLSSCMLRKRAKNLNQIAVLTSRFSYHLRLEPTSTTLRLLTLFCHLLQIAFNLKSANNSHNLNSPRGNATHRKANEPLHKKLPTISPVLDADYENQTERAIIQTASPKMWPNTGFGNNEPYQNNSKPDDGPFPPFTGNGHPPTPGQQFLTQRPNTMQFANQNGEGFVPKDFQSEAELFNNRAFLQNQFVNQDAQVCFVEPKNWLEISGINSSTRGQQEISRMQC